MIIDEDGTDKTESMNIDEDVTGITEIMMMGEDVTDMTEIMIFITEIATIMAIVITWKIGLEILEETLDSNTIPTVIKGIKKNQLFSHLAPSLKSLKNTILSG